MIIYLLICLLLETVFCRVLTSFLILVTLIRYTFREQIWFHAQQFRKFMDLLWHLRQNWSVSHIHQIDLWQLKDRILHADPVIDPFFLQKTQDAVICNKRKEWNKKISSQGIIIPHVWCIRLEQILEHIEWFLHIIPEVIELKDLLWLLSCVCQYCYLTCPLRVEISPFTLWNPCIVIVLLDVLSWGDPQICGDRIFLFSSRNILLHASGTWRNPSCHMNNLWSLNSSSNLTSAWQTLAVFHAESVFDNVFCR